MSSSLIDIIDGETGVKRPLSIIVKMHSTQDQIRHNVTTNLKRDTPRFMSLPLLQARNQPLAIVGGGPGLNKRIGEIRQFTNIMVCGSAHDHLISKGVIPTFSVAVDAKEDAVNWFTNPQKETTYLLASQCHPNMFDKMADHKIAMWHFKGQLDNEEDYFKEERTINWGCMVGVLSVQMALFLGFQELHFFGMDASHDGENHHSYDVGDDEVKIFEDRTVFECNGKPFLSTMALISQMEHFFDVFASSDGQYIKGYVHNDDLWAECIKASPPEMKEWLEVV